MIHAVITVLRILLKKPTPNMKIQASLFESHFKLNLKNVNNVDFLGSEERNGVLPLVK